MKPDVALEQAFGAAKAEAKRIRHGRLVLVLEKMDGRVIDYWQETDALTTADMERLMAARPHKDREVGR